MTKLTAALLGATILALPSAASAADLMISTPPSVDVYAPEVHDWTGFYLGVNGGFASGTADWTGDYIAGGVVAGSEDGSIDLDGGMAGIQAGANMQMGNFVLGIEGDVDWADISGEGDEIDPLSADPSVPSASLDWLASLRGRAGFAIDNVLLYGTAGVAWGGGELGITNLDGAGDDVTADISASGWTAGVGAELAVTDNMSIKAEYLYTSLSMDEVSFDDVPPADSLAVNSDFDFSTVKVGVNFSF
jgi:outer membrane immunogenic protein